MLAVNNFPNGFNTNSSGLGCITTLLLLALLFSSIGLGWVVNGLFIVITLLFVIPIVTLFGFQWWVNRQRVEGNCPVCQYPIVGLNNTELQCPNCGEALSVKDKKLIRSTPPGTIEVTAVQIDE